MPHLSIKDVPEKWALALRQRAARNHRSLQGELMAIVERAVDQAECPTSGHAGPPGGDPAKGPRVAGYDRGGFPIIRQGWKTVEQVVAELKTQFPKPIADQLSSIDIIRQDRDSR